VPGGPSAVRHLRWTIAEIADGDTATVGFAATVDFPTDAGTVITNTAVLTDYCSWYEDLERCYDGNDDEATTTVEATDVASGSTMTNSAFELRDDLGPWTINDFEILLNTKNTIVATNPGQFYYHQRVDNTFPATTDMKFALNWDANFAPQTISGQPIHAYVQLATDPPNTWRDVTGSATGKCWNAAQNTCGGADGTITAQNVPAGATVWVNVHLDYKLKGETVSSTFLKKPIEYGPFSSDVEIRDDATQNLVGVSSSETSLVGRGKKVTVLYGTATAPGGGPLPGAWVRISQGSRSALVRAGIDGDYLLYDGQLCTLPDGIEACSGSATSWSFNSGSNQSTIVSVLGDGATATSSATNPAGATKGRVWQGNQTFLNFTSSPTYTFGVTKGDAYKRNWEFKP
jgi:hypothetical protein